MKALRPTQRTVYITWGVGLAAVVFVWVLIWSKDLSLVELKEVISPVGGARHDPPAAASQN
jgi:hypothetical protein